MAAVTGQAVGAGSARGKKKEVKARDEVMKTIYDMKTGDEVMKTIYDMKTGDEVMKTIYDVKARDEVMKTIYDTDTEDKKTIYDLARNAVTTLVSVTAAALASAQGDVSKGYRVAGTVGMFIFLKWLMLDAWDGIRELVTGRRRENERSNHGI